MLGFNLENSCATNSFLFYCTPAQTVHGQVDGNLSDDKYYYTYILIKPNDVDDFIFNFTVTNARTLETSTSALAYAPDDKESMKQACNVAHSSFAPHEKYCLWINDKLNREELITKLETWMKDNKLCK